MLPSKIETLPRTFNCRMLSTAEVSSGLCFFCNVYVIAMPYLFHLVTKQVIRIKRDTSVLESAHQRRCRIEMVVSSLERESSNLVVLLLLMPREVITVAEASGINETQCNGRWSAITDIK